jgi:uncharacterized Ntn-hydrolase superfamily protein
MTFSIAAYCRRTREFGCATTTSSMAAGNRVCFVAADAGVVLTQARTDPRLGSLGLQRLEGGRSAEEALADIIASTPHAAWRQLGVVDRSGRVAVFTGGECAPAKGSRVGDGVLVIGNGLANESVLDAMLRGFEKASETALADRLLIVLEQGLAAGGEPDPLRSAALRVAQPGVPVPFIDLRVDFSEAPIAELKRIWTLWSPMVEGYVQRCLDPAVAPPAAAIEGHLAR